jgi:HD-GYP domain-containing protein (c-di-GMP phosphodiesterase class II)
MLKKVAVEDLRVGAYVHKVPGSWLSHSLWRTRFLISRQFELDNIIASGVREVWVDTEKSVAADSTTDAPPEPIQSEATAARAAVRSGGAEKAPMNEELMRAAEICARSKKAVTSMFEEARMGKSLSSEPIYELVGEVASSVMRNPGALISLARLKTADDYTYMHSVAVCALMVALAHEMELDEDEQRDAGIAGLVHDIGKALVPPEILNKPGTLTAEEFRIVKTHPAQGHRLLTEGGAMREIARDVCLHHHEKMDGTGYPDKLKGVQIGVFARMGAVCDVYDAITSDRPYKAGWDPAESIHRMAKWSRFHFDDRIFQHFVKSIGIFPVGSLVHLSSGRLAVVVEQNSKSLLTPKVNAFFSAKSRTRVPAELIDLSQPGVDEKIVGREQPEKWGIENHDQYWVGNSRSASPPAMRAA